MRLSSHQKAVIIQEIGKHLREKPATLKLYGSRVDDKKKGGDIDLLLIVPTEQEANRLKREKLSILIAITNQIGEQKIDLQFATELNCANSPFFKMILPSSVVLNTW